MPFVPSDESLSLLNKAAYAPTLETEEDPAVMETLGAYWRQENIIGSGLNQEIGLPETKDNPDFDAYSFFTEEEKSDRAFVSQALYADNEEEILATRRQVTKERADRDIMARAGAVGVALGLPVMVMDPISLLSIGGVALNTYRAGKGILKGAAVMGSVVGAETAIQEAALHTQQLTRTYGESAINISAGMLLGGVLGGTAAKLATYGVDAKMIAAYEDVMNVEPKIAEGINPTINAVTEPVGSGSVGAQQVLGDTQVSGKVARFLTKYLGKFDPLSRTITSEAPPTRLITTMMSENPIEMDGNILQAAESLAKAHSGKLGVSLQNNANMFSEYKSSGGLMNRKQFNEAVATAIRKGDSDIPQVKASADFWNKELYTPLKDEMIALKLLPEDVDVKTANNYLNRVWNKNKISANFPQFVNKVSNWLAEKDVKLFEDAKAASDRIATTAGKEKDELQSIIDKAEFKKGMDFERQDYESLAEEIAQRIQGSPDGRLPYDWKMGDGSNSRKLSGTALRGPLRSRVFQIDDEIVEEFLENDIETLGARYLQNVAGDIELVRKFGDVTMEDQLKDINKWYAKQKNNKSLTPRQQKNLEKNRVSDNEDIAGMRDRIRGVYGFSADNIFTRMMRSSRDLNYLRLLGGVTVSSLPDVARVFMAEGFAKTFSSGLGPLIKNTKTFKESASELKRYGVGTDAIMSGKSDIIADVGDYAQGGTMVERGLRSATSKFGKINFLDYWTAGIKQLHAVTMQTSIFDALAKGKYDKRLARLGIDEQSATDMYKQVVKHGKKTEGVWLTNAKNWDRPDLERMWGAAVRKESDRVIVIPGQEKPLFMSREMGKTVGQFRSFILSATQRVFIAGLQNQDHNALGGFASLVGMGMFTYNLKQKIAGREVSDDPAVWIMEGIDRSGVVGIIGEVTNTMEKLSGNSLGLRPLLGIDAPASKQVSRSVQESALGPTFGSLLSTGISASNALISKDEMTEADIRTLRRLIPLQNLFYLRGQFDKAQEAISDL
jgi:DNA-binding phage protein